MLISNWKQAHKLWSVQCALALVVVNLMMVGLPYLQGVMNTHVYSLLNALLGGGVILLRVLSQINMNPVKSDD